MDDVIDDFEEFNFTNCEIWELESYVGPNKEYYLKKWAEFKKGNNTSMNWAAFIFGILWMVYRKMYLEAGILFSIVLVESYLTDYFFYDLLVQNPAIQFAIQITYSVITGLFGNYLYLKSATRAIHKARSPLLDKEQFASKLSQIGGTSLIALGIVFLALFIWIFIPLVIPFYG